MNAHTHQPHFPLSLTLRLGERVPSSLALVMLSSSHCVLGLEGVERLCSYDGGFVVSLIPAINGGFPFSCFGEMRLAGSRLLLYGEATLPVEDGRSSAGARSRSGGRKPGGRRGNAMGKLAM